MAVWFLRGLRRGVVTTRYPKAVEDWAASLPTPPAFRPELLTPELVDRLIGVCPAAALRRDEEALVVDLGACTACGLCIRAGGAAVTPSGVWELAALKRTTLVVRIPISGTAG
jgi:NAD-dependent dihydropyrimidine dehydrogenase PreA subunit